MGGVSPRNKRYVGIAESLVFVDGCASAVLSLQESDYATGAVRARSTTARSRKLPALREGATASLTRPVGPRARPAADPAHSRDEDACAPFQITAAS